MLVPFNHRHRVSLNFGPARNSLHRGTGIGSLFSGSLSRIFGGISRSGVIRNAISRSLKLARKHALPVAKNIAKKSVPILKKVAERGVETGVDILANSATNLVDNALNKAENHTPLTAEIAHAAKEIVHEEAANAAARSKKALKRKVDRAIDSIAHSPAASHKSPKNKKRKNKKLTVAQKLAQVQG